MNSVYDYDPLPKKDELIGIIVKVVEIVVQLVNPGVEIIVSAVPAGEASTSSCHYAHSFSPLLVLNLPSWLPGMSFKRNMVIARELTERYVEKPFAHSLQKSVSGCELSHSCLNKSAKSNGDIAHSMVRDALENMEEKGASPDESWMKALKEAAATAFLGMQFITLVNSLFINDHSPLFQVLRRRCVTYRVPNRLVVDGRYGK